MYCVGGVVAVVSPNRAERVLQLHWCWGKVSVFKGKPEDVRGEEDRWRRQSGGGGKRRGDISRGGGQQEEGRQADFLYDLCYGQPLREIGTLAARRRGTFLRLRVRCVAASAVNVDCSPRPSVPAARSARLCPAPLPQIAPKERHWWPRSSARPTLPPARCVSARKPRESAPLAGVARREDRRKLPRDGCSETGRAGWCREPPLA